jgi:hypothetical protein
LWQALHINADATIRYNKDVNENHRDQSRAFGISHQGPSMRLTPDVDLLLHPGSIAECDQFAVMSLPDQTTAALSAACRTSAAPFVGLGGLTGPIDAASLQHAARPLDAGQADIALLPFHGYEWLETLADLPAAILLRFPQVIQGSLVVVRREQLLASVAQREPNETVHGILVQLADAGCRINLRSGMLSAAPLAAFTPPALVPVQHTSSGSGLEQVLEFDPRRVAPVQSREDITALRAGLFQVHDALPQSHALAQTIEGRGRHQAGDYWHAIMHRREPDYANASYWFRHVGAHPIHAELASRASRLLAASAHAEVALWRSRLPLPGRWDSPAFVDLCEQAAADESDPLGQVARRIQWTEMLLLLNSTCQDAFGSGSTVE